MAPAPAPALAPTVLARPVRRRREVKMHGTWPTPTSAAAAAAARARSLEAAGADFVWDFDARWRLAGGWRSPARSHSLAGGGSAAARVPGRSRRHRR